MSFFSNIGHQLDPHRVIDEVHRGIDEAIHGLEEAGHHISEEAINHLKGEVSSLVNQARTEFEKDIQKIEDAFKHIGDLKNAFTTETISSSIGKVLEVADACPIYPDEVDLVLGVVAISFGSIHEKVHHLKEYHQSPPQGREQIINFVKQLLPSSITLKAEGTLIITLGVDMTWTADNVEIAMNYILDKAGL